MYHDSLLWVSAGQGQGRFTVLQICSVPLHSTHPAARRVAFFLLCTVLPFSGHKLEVTVHTALRLCRKCFFRKNAGWGFLDLTASSLSTLSKLTTVYLLTTEGQLGHTWTLTNVNKAARDACRFPCHLHQPRSGWDHRAQQLRTRLSWEKLPFNLAVPFVHILTGLPPSYPEPQPALLPQCSGLSQPNTCGMYPHLVNLWQMEAGPFSRAYVS